MMPGHSPNPIFFNKKKDWTSRTLANPQPVTSDNISFLPNPPPPPPPPPPPSLKVEVICVSPLTLSIDPSIKRHPHRNFPTDYI